MKGSSSHKMIDLAGNPILKIYCTSRVSCSGHYTCIQFSERERERERERKRKRKRKREREHVAISNNAAKFQSCREKQPKWQTFENPQNKTPSPAPSPTATQLKG